MPFYYGLKRFGKDSNQRTIDRLLALRKSLQKQIPPRTVRSTLLLATWNIRDFDSNKFKHGPRLPESYYYIAEIMSAFDLIAVQEVNRNLKALERVVDILGPNWDYIATDITEGPSGNQERMTFVYDKRKVLFQHIAGEIVLPISSLVQKERQFARTPFSASFQSGWFKFDLCTVHLYYGATSGEKYKRRVEEIGRISKFLAKRAKKEDSNVILLGDMNVVGPDDDTMKALKENKFIVPEELSLTTNMKGDKYYDQIAFMLKKNELELGPSENNAGVFNPFTTVFPTRDSEVYFPLGKKNGKWPATKEARKNYFKNQWRTWQISDHLPLWVELKIDFTDKYLKRIRKA